MDVALLATLQLQVRRCTIVRCAHKARVCAGDGGGEGCVQQNVKALQVEIVAAPQASILSCGSALCLASQAMHLPLHVVG